MATATPAPRADYTQLLRGSSYHAAKPVGGFFAIIFLWIIAQVIALVTAAALRPGGFLDAFRAYGEGLVTPTLFLALNLGLASTLVFALLAVRVIHSLPAGFAHSVLGRFRWGLAGRFTLASLATMGIVLVLGAVLPVGEQTGTGQGRMEGSIAAFALVLLLTTPLQAAGEEYLFRGYLMQATGALLKNRWVPVFLTALLFALAHGAQNPPLFVDRFAFGIIAGVAVVLTGGLEAGIAMHVVNNVAALAFALVAGNLDQALTVTEVGWSQLPVSIVKSLVFLAFVVWIARRYGVATRTPALDREPATV